MQSDRSGLPLSRPRVFNYSLDWRFLLPRSHPDKIFIFFEEDPDFCQTLEHVGIPRSSQLSFLDIEQKAQKEASALVLPFGLPVHWVSAERTDQVEFFRSIRKLMGEHGHLLVGFNNSRGYRPKGRANYYFSTPQRITSQLQDADFRIVNVFGVISNLNIPEYIFDLNSRSMHFALQHRFKRKLFLSNLLQLLMNTAAMHRFSDYLPCYFVTAMV